MHSSDFIYTDIARWSPQSVELTPITSLGYPFLPLVMRISLRNFQRYNMVLRTLATVLDPTSPAKGCVLCTRVSPAGWQGEALRDPGGWRSHHLNSACCQPEAKSCGGSRTGYGMLRPEICPPPKGGRKGNPTLYQGHMEKGPLHSGSGDRGCFSDTVHRGHDVDSAPGVVQPRVLRPAENPEPLSLQAMSFPPVGG